MKESTALRLFTIAIGVIFSLILVSFIITGGSVFDIVEVALLGILYLFGLPYALKWFRTKE